MSNEICAAIEKLYQSLLYLKAWRDGSGNWKNAVARLYGVAKNFCEVYERLYKS